MTLDSQGKEAQEPEKAGESSVSDFLGNLEADEYTALALCADLAVERLCGLKSKILDLATIRNVMLAAGVAFRRLAGQAGPTPGKHMVARIVAACGRGPLRLLDGPGDNLSEEEAVRWLAIALLEEVCETNALWGDRHGAGALVADLRKETAECEALCGPLQVYHADQDKEGFWAAVRDLRAHGRPILVADDVAGEVDVSRSIVRDQVHGYVLEVSRGHERIGRLRKTGAPAPVMLLVAPERHSELLKTSKLELRAAIEHFRPRERAQMRERHEIEAKIAELKAEHAAFSHEDPIVTRAMNAMFTNRIAGLEYALGRDSLPPTRHAEQESGE